jgi:hypothetical protein
MNFGEWKSPRTEGAQQASPGQRPGCLANNRNKALKGRRIAVAPLQGFVLFECNTQGGARSSLALGWLIAGPLALSGCEVERDLRARFGVRIARKFCSRETRPEVAFHHPASP